MTLDERAQLIEDIKKSTNKRQQIIERAEMSEHFDIAAAFKEVAELDASIADRLVESIKSEN